MFHAHSKHKFTYLLTLFNREAEQEAASKEIQRKWTFTDTVN